MSELVTAGEVEVEVIRYGPPDGWAAVLLHGFPYDHRAMHASAELLADAGAHVVVPSLRGYAGTRFRDAGTLRSGQQAALGHDLHELIDTLGLERPVVAGYDWGGRAACVVAAIWPQSVSGLVSVNGYNVQDIAAAATTPADPEGEHRRWYQYYLHGERGRLGLTRQRDAFARYLWALWSPTWAFDDSTFAATAASFANDDFVDVVVHSYRHRYGLVAGDPAYADTEAALAAKPRIEVPTIVLDGADDAVNLARDRAAHEPHFTALLDYRRLDGVGHNVPQEAPEAFAAAVLDVRAATQP